MRLSLCLLLASVVACGAEPLCVDNDGEELPVCSYEDVEGPPLEYCPGEHWAASDGCNSCGCDDQGVVQCTSSPCTP